MSTDELIQVCMDYPLYGNYLVYNNELDGIKVVMNHFNAFVELRQRRDAADRLISYYEKIDIGNIAEKAMTCSFVDSGFSILHLGYLELILCSEFIPNVYSSSNISRLGKIQYEKYEEKLRYPNVYSIQTIKKSLLLGAQIKLESGTLDNGNSLFLSKFVERGGAVEVLEDYTKVSRIINNE